MYSGAEEKKRVLVALCQSKLSRPRRAVESEGAGVIEERLAGDGPRWQQLPLVVLDLRQQWSDCVGFKRWLDVMFDRG